MEQTLPYFELISHPDRTLKEHLDACNEISAKLLDMKYLSDNFFLKNEIEQLRKLLIYFHDFGKATDYFQYKIIKATVQENHEDFIQKHESYLIYFQKNKKAQIQEELYKNPNLSNYAKLGGYFVFSNYYNENKLLNIFY